MSPRGSPQGAPATEPPSMPFCTTSRETRTDIFFYRGHEAQRGEGDPEHQLVGGGQGAGSVSLRPTLRSALTLQRQPPRALSPAPPSPAPPPPKAQGSSRAACHASLTLTSCPAGPDRSFNQSTQSTASPDAAGQMRPPGHLVGLLFLTWACACSGQGRGSGVQGMGKEPSSGGTSRQQEPASREGRRVFKSEREGVV